MSGTAKDRFMRFWFEAIEAERWVLFQRAFAATFLFYVVGWGQTATEWLTDNSFHITRQATNPVYPMPFPSVPEAWLIPFLIVLYGTPTLLILNLGGRAAKLCMLALAVYIQLVDQISSFTLNKLYIVFFAFILLAPSPVTVQVRRRTSSPRLKLGIPVVVIVAALGCVAFGLIARLTTVFGDLQNDPKRIATYLFFAALAVLFVWWWQQPKQKPPGEAETARAAPAMSAWPVRMVQTTLMIQYTTAGLCKVFWGDWMYVPDILFGHSVGLYRTEIAALLIEYMPHPAWWFLSYGALSFEMFAILLFVPRQMRVHGAWIGFAFHMVIAVMMKDLIYFSLQMCTFYILFLPSRWVIGSERAIARRLPWSRAKVSESEQFFEPEGEPLFYWFRRRN